MIAIAPILTLAQGRPVVSSLTVAAHFGKSHKHVLRDIQHLMESCPEDFNGPNFGPVEYLDGKGEMRPAFNLTRDAFSLLVMGFTGRKALAWKLRYIEAFNVMEAELTRRVREEAGASIQAQTEGLRRIEARLAAMEATTRGDPVEVLRLRLREEARKRLHPETLAWKGDMVAGVGPKGAAALEILFLRNALYPSAPKPRRRRKRS